MPKSNNANKQGQGATAGATASGGSNNNKDKKNNNHANNKGKSQDSGNGSNNNNKNHHQSFKGRTAEMHEHVFKLPTKVNQYPTTVNIMKEYKGKTYTKTAAEMLVLFKRTPKAPAVKKGTANPVGTEPDGSVSARDEKMWELLLAEEIKQAHHLEQNMLSFFQVIMGQCDKALTANLNGEPDFDTRQRNRDCLWLLTKIRSLVNCFDGSQYVHGALWNIQRGLDRLKQNDMSNTEYFNAFNKCIHTMNKTKAWSLPPLDQDPSAHVAGNTDDKNRQAIREQQNACQFIMRADKKCYGPLKMELAKQYARGHDGYPKTLVHAYQLLNDKEKINHDAKHKSNRNQNSGHGHGGHGRGGGRGKGRPQNHNQNGGRDSNSSLKGHQFLTKNDGEC